MILLMTGICVHSFFVKAESPVSNKPEQQETPSIANSITAIYRQIDFKGTSKLDPEVFRQAYIGYLNLLEAGMIADDKHILSVCDFSLSANTKRLWVLDMDKKTVLFHSLVAHGQGTGDEFASRFSDREHSHQSSLGFYITDDTYIGSNGYSLKLHGKDRGFNANAYQRAIVIHGADYVSEQFIRNNKRLGRSWGCPAVPAKLARPIIDSIKNGSCLFVYYPNKNYNKASTWLAKTPEHLRQNPLLNTEPGMHLSRTALAMTNAEAEASAQQQEAMQGIPADILPEKSLEPDRRVHQVYQGVQLALPPAK